MNFIEEKLKEAKAKGLQGIRFDITKENIIYLEKEGYTQWDDDDEGEIIVIDINDDNKDYIFLNHCFDGDYLKVKIPKENKKLSFLEEQHQLAMQTGYFGVRISKTKENIEYLENEGFTHWGTNEEDFIALTFSHQKQYVFLSNNFKSKYFEITLPIENETKQTKHKDLNSLIKCHRVHYLKWDITNDLSIRYHFTFQDKKELENRFIIKCHNDKVWNTIRDDVAEAIIKESNLESKEIIGKLENEEYKKIIVKDDTYSNNTLSTIKE